MASLYGDVLSRLPLHWENGRVFWDEGRVYNPRLVESPELAELDGRPTGIGTCAYLRSFRRRENLLSEELKQLYGWDEDWFEEVEDEEVWLKWRRQGQQWPCHLTPF